MSLVANLLAAYRARTSAPGTDPSMADWAAQEEDAAPPAYGDVMTAPTRHMLEYHTRILNIGHALSETGSTKGVDPDTERALAESRDWLDDLDTRISRLGFRDYARASAEILNADIAARQSVSGKVWFPDDIGTYREVLARLESGPPAPEAKKGVRESLRDLTRDEGADPLP